jgi:hypothetical protein
MSPICPYMALDATKIHTPITLKIRPCTKHYSEVSAGVFAWPCFGSESMTPNQASFSAQCTWKVGGYAAGLSKVGV